MPADTVPAGEPPAGATDVLDDALLSILACPDEHHAPLDYDPAAATLTCTECGRIFDVVDGIPVLLLDESRLAGAEPDAPTPTKDR